MPFALAGTQDVEGMSGVTLALVAPLGHFGYGLLLGWLWHRSNNIWIVALAHGFGNNWGNLPFRFIEGLEGHEVSALLIRAAFQIAAGMLCLRFFLGRPTAA